MKIEAIAKGLTEAQRDYLCAHYDRKRRAGRPHGLVSRGLLCYLWGLDSNMGYGDTRLGLAVRNYIKDQDNG